VGLASSPRGQRRKLDLWEIPMAYGREKGGCGVRPCLGPPGVTPKGFTQRLERGYTL